VIKWTDRVLNDAKLSPPARQALLALRKQADGHPVVRADLEEVASRYGIDGAEPGRAVEEARGSSYLNDCGELTILTLP